MTAIHVNHRYKYAPCDFTKPHSCVETTILRRHFFIKTRRRWFDHIQNRRRDRIEKVLHELHVPYSYDTIFNKERIFTGRTPKVTIPEELYARLNIAEDCLAILMHLLKHPDTSHINLDVLIAWSYAAYRIHTSVGDLTSLLSKIDAKAHSEDGRCANPHRLIDVARTLQKLSFYHHIREIHDLLVAGVDEEMITEMMQSDRDTQRRMRG